MPAKLERCVRKVKAKNRRARKKVNPYAVCKAAIGKSSHRRKKRKR